MSNKIIDRPKMQHPKVVTQDEWLAARLDLLAREKQLTRERDEVNRLRRELPWVKVEKNYVFDGPEGKVSLNDLFAGRSQLIVSHFMFGPQLERGMRRLLVPLRSRRRHARTSRASRCVFCYGFARAPG